MAVGVRITSNNLNGKTASVSFIPVSGYTSGATQNLGTQTIPFNNITSYPYGEYSLYFSEYDYTYNLTVDPDKGVNQSYTFVSRITGVTTNYASTLLNFGDLSASIIDLGIEYADWDLYDLYPLNEKGYMYFFQGQGSFTSNEKLVLFTDYAGNTLLQYSGTTNNYNYDIGQGTLAYFSFVDLGVLLYTDGLSGYTYTWSVGTGAGEFDEFDVEWDWDLSNIYSQFVIKLSNSNTLDNEFYLINRGVSTLLTTSNDAVSYKYFSYQVVSNFFMCFEYLPSYEYQNLKIYDSTGNLSDTIVLPDTYDFVSYGQFGNNQFGALFHNSLDSGVDYFIVRYNGNNQNITTTTHVRGTDYEETSLIYEGGLYPSETDKSSWVVMLYQVADFQTISGHVFNYCDVIYTLDNNETIYSEVYQNEGAPTKSFYLYFIHGRRPFTYGNTGDGNFSVISFTTSGLTFNPIGPLTDYDSNFMIRYPYGDKVVFDLRDNMSVTHGFLYSISADNVLQDTLEFNLTGEYNYQSLYTYGVFYWNDGTNGWCLNNNNLSFSSIGYYQSSTTSIGLASDFRYSNVLLLNPSGAVRILTQDLVTDEISLPSNNGYSTFGLGKNRFLYVYGDSSDNKIHMELYDIYGNLINSQKVEYTNYYTTQVTKDRFVLIINDSANNAYVNYLISDNSIKSLTTSNFYNYYAVNDYVYWTW